MSTSDVRRQQLIQAAMAKHTSEAAEVAMQLWQPLTSQLVSIIGTGGFDALYARSFYITQAMYPWMAPDNASSPADSRLIDLQNSLKGHTATEAHKASFMLILTFTNILASLIGEPLTNSILNSAWGDNAPDKDIAVKELPHE